MLMLTPERDERERREREQEVGGEAREHLHDRLSEPRRRAGSCPIHTPIGTHTSVANTSSTTTRANVAAPSSEAVRDLRQPDAGRGRRCSAGPRRRRRRRAPPTAPPNTMSPARRRAAGTITAARRRGRGSASPGRAARPRAPGARPTHARPRRAREQIEHDRARRLAGLGRLVAERSDQATSGRQNSTLTAITITIIVAIARAHRAEVAVHDRRPDDTSRCRAASTGGRGP